MQYIAGARLLCLLIFISYFKSKLISSLLKACVIIFYIFLIKFILALKLYDINSFQSFLKLLPLYSLSIINMEKIKEDDICVFTLKALLLGNLYV